MTQFRAVFDGVKSLGTGSLCRVWMQSSASFRLGAVAQRPRFATPVFRNEFVAKTLSAQQRVQRHPQRDRELNDLQDDQIGLGQGIAALRMSGPRLGHRRLVRPGRADEPRKNPSVGWSERGPQTGDLAESRKQVGAGRPPPALPSSPC